VARRHVKDQNTANEPILLDRPFLVASVVDATADSYVTFHVYARYRDAPEDRPIPVNFSIVRTNLSPEAAEAVEQMLQYGTPVSLPESVVSDVNIDIPGGLGIHGGGGSIWLGPAHAVDAEPGRASVGNPPARQCGSRGPVRVATRYV
jgi:hypothetical protein